MTAAGDPPVLELRGAALSAGGRTLWRGLDLRLEPGGFLAVLGPNGSGKSSLLRAILGLPRLDAGEIRFLGRPVRRGDRRIGYIPQQRLIPAGTPLRARDLVRLGLDGHRFGPPLPSRETRERVDAALASVGMAGFADRPVGDLSGGEQQRLRVAQALVGDPKLLLCDEPLLNLDLAGQALVTGLLDDRRRTGTPVVFVTHDVNPVLRIADRVLYLAAGRHRLGAPDEVFRTEVLSELYGSPVEVVRVRDRLVVIGGDAATVHVHGEDG